VLWHTSDPKSGAMIELGRRRPLARPIGNSTLTEEQRCFEGENNVFIQCQWTLIAPAGRLPRRVPANNFEKWNQEMDLIVGARIRAAVFSASTLELRIDFHNGISLRIRPQGRPATYSAYSICLDSDYWSVFSDGRVEFSPS
jgi:hypothetical protein